MPYTEPIITYFLNLFKLQCRNPDIDGADCRVLPVASEAGSEPVYDLQVKCDGSWKSRRMTIRQLGEEVESKSTCFKVIYDDQLVVKIPPKPIQDFKKYLDQINNERNISSRLAPNVQCVFPTLSAILMKIPGLIDTRELSDTALEEKCIRLLTYTPRLQSYLKIKDSFVFFMNLSKNAFFNQVIEKIHEEKERVEKEIIKSTWVFDNPEAFETVYGEGQHDIFFSTKRAYKDFEAKTDELLRKHKVFDSVPEYKKKEWFFSILAKKEPDIEEKGFPDNFAAEARNIFESIMIANQHTVHNYRKTIKTFVRKKIFETNKKNIEGLSLNILNLIYELKNQAVSVRDLKPDNIYLSLKTKGALDHFWDYESYSLGLIDLETAIDFKPSDPEALGQPLLAGTPSYMTPAHIFKNDILKTVFGANIHRILYMQDWFAALSMMFIVATGKMLFRKTAKLIPQIMGMKKKAMALDKPLSKVFKRISSGFWTLAEEEFHAKLNDQKEKFSTLIFSLPKPISAMLADELVHEKSILLEAIEKYIKSNGLLNEISSELIGMSHYELAQYSILWEKGILGSEMETHDRKKVEYCMKNLKILKSHLESHERLNAMLAQPISCYELMDFLFNRVMLTAYNPAWNKTPSGNGS